MVRSKIQQQLVGPCLVSARPSRCHVDASQVAAIGCNIMALSFPKGRPICAMRPQCCACTSLTPYTLVVVSETELVRWMRVLWYMPLRSPVPTRSRRSTRASPGSMNPTNASGYLVDLCLLLWIIALVTVSELIQAASCMNLNFQHDLLHASDIKGLGNGGRRQTTIDFTRLQEMHVLTKVPELLCTKVLMLWTVP